MPAPTVHLSEHLYEQVMTELRNAENLAEQLNRGLAAAAFRATRQAIDEARIHGAVRPLNEPAEHDDHAVQASAAQDWHNARTAAYYDCPEANCG